MRSIVVDTGLLIALFDRNDRYHIKARGFIDAVMARLVTNLPVLTEAAHLLRFSAEAQRDMLWWVHDCFAIDCETAADLPRIMAILDRYRDLPADFADASLVAMAERLDLADVATFDSDFEHYRLFGKSAFTNVIMAPK
jgi:predicted nucleic acid-binding protein